MKRAFLIASGVCLAAAAVVLAASQTATETIPINGAERVNINCDFGAGTLTLGPGDMKDAVVVEVRYDPRQVDYFIDHTVRHDELMIDLESERRRDNGIDVDENIWDVTVSRRYPTAISMDIGASDATMELGGIPLTEFDLDIGAASGEIRFSERNPNRLREISIDAGASSLSIEGLGNANFEHFTFSGGAGSFDFDFSGDAWDGESVVTIEVGVASADLVIPKGLPVMLTIDGNNWLSSVDVHGVDVDMDDTDHYESPDFQTAKNRLVIDIEVGLGSVDVYFQK